MVFQNNKKFEKNKKKTLAIVPSSFHPIFSACDPAELNMAGLLKGRIGKQKPRVNGKGE